MPENSYEIDLNAVQKRQERALGMLGFLKKWFKRKDGSTAIEFSLLAIPFLMLSLSTIELSLMYASASLLEGATDSAARLLRTGQIQQSGTPDPEGMFREAMCEFATTLINCEDVVIEVIAMNSYTDFDDYAAQTDEGGNMISSGFSAGGSNDRILIRTAYLYTMVTPFVGPLLNGDDGGTLFISTIVLQSEPYEFEDES